MTACKTAEQIYNQACAHGETEIGQRRFINAEFRRQDDSDKWPILGRFNVTERAIRHAHKFERDSDIMSPYEYALFLEQETSRIVNDSNNWLRVCSVHRTRDKPYR
jgi:hypothetical protein